MVGCSGSTCFNTQPPEGGCVAAAYFFGGVKFQHTAARRRLLDSEGVTYLKDKFQHTAARRRLKCNGTFFTCVYCFNTQPPEGGCHISLPIGITYTCFNTQPPEGG